MQLVIDAGNTLTKAAIFNGDEVVVFEQSARIAAESVLTWCSEYSISRAIISDVAGSGDDISRELSTGISVLNMNAQTPTPLQMDYETPQTLGPDRLAAAVLGHSLFPQNHVLVIQTGTCITFEFITPDGSYKGGAISPGLDLRLKAMNTFTAKLPLVKKKEIHFLTGKNTEESILSGVMNGCIAEIDGIIDQYKHRYPDLMVVLGGGDAIYFDKKLKNRIFATENLVLRGLNEVLKFNHAHFEK